MNKNQENKIQAVFKLAITAMKGVYMESAIDMERLSSKELLNQGFKFDYNKIATKTLSSYAKNLGKGGSICVERVIEPMGNGMVKVYAEKQFVPWLDDFCKEKADGIITEIQQMELGGVHPKDIAKAIKGDFENTRHRAMVASRTEASKVRNDVRSQRFTDQGVQYVEWRTAGDDRVREEHELRDGKIYRHEDAPEIGEYNCRCLLVPADYKVDRGAKVEEDGGIIMPESALI